MAAIIDDPYESVLGGAVRDERGMCSFAMQLHRILYAIIAVGFTLHFYCVQYNTSDSQPHLHTFHPVKDRRV